MMLTETPPSVRRRREPTTAPATGGLKSDFNFNTSPGHHSSRDGSFIQDEAEMQLILDYNDEAAAYESGKLASARSGSSAGYQPSSVLTASWVQRQCANWATDYDANIAELDFDHAQTDAILGLPASRDRFHGQEHPSSVDGEHKFWASVGEEALMVSANQNLGYSLPASIRRAPMKGSLELSSGESLFSSSAAPPNSHSEEALEALAACGGFISTDSLDASALDSEQLRTACATNKADYRLTFETSRMAESGFAISTLSHDPASYDPYSDAPLSRVGDNTLLRSPSPPGQRAEELERSSNSLTTWGRIRRSYDFPLPINTAQAYPKSSSMPSLLKSPCSVPEGAQEGMVQIYNLTTSNELNRSQGRESPGNHFSLLSAFRQRFGLTSANLLDEENLNGERILPEEEEDVEQSSGYVTGDNQNPDYRPQLVPTDDFTYAEYYVGNGRYVDVNQNEIGFVPPNTNGVQHVVESGQPRAARPEAAATRPSPSDHEPTTPSSEVYAALADRWLLARPQITKIAPSKPPRTFAALFEEARGDSDASARGAEERSSMGAALRNSATQLPVHVSDRAVQTAGADNGRLIPTLFVPSALGRHAPTPDNNVDSGKFAPPPPLDFLKFPFAVPPLMRSVAPFPVSLLARKLTELAPSTELAEQLLPPSSAAAAARVDEVSANFRPPSAANQAIAAAAGRHYPPAGRMATKAPSQSQGFLLGLPAAAAAGDDSPGLGLPSLPPFLQRLHQRSSSSGASGRNDDSRCYHRRQLSKESSGSGGGVTRERDSGLGTSGPAHIQDWDSLATLLPRDVVQACSFFKANSQLLARSVTAAQSIDKAAGGRAPRPQSVPTRRRRCSGRMAERFESIDEETGAAYRGGGCPCCAQASFAASEPLPHEHLHCHHNHRPVVLCCCPLMVAASSPGCCTSRRTRRCHCGQSAFSNLKRWRARRAASHGFDAMAESGSDRSEPELSKLSSLRSSSGLRRTISSYPHNGQRSRTLERQLSMSSSSGSSDSDCRDDVAAETMSSEYQLRERDPDVQLPQFRSLQCFDQTTADGSNQMRQAADGKRACATCFRLRSPTSAAPQPPAWAADKKHSDDVCDCRTSDVLEQLRLEQMRRRRRRRFGGFDPEELAVRNTDIYRQKKDMVESACDACKTVRSQFGNLPANEIERNAVRIKDAVRNSLCPTMEKLLADGLKPGCDLWTTIRASTAYGPATKSVHKLVTELNSNVCGDAREGGDLFRKFVGGLLRLGSLDCWLAYLALKDKLIDEHYEEAAFMRRADSAYGSQLDRLVDALQPLSQLPFHKIIADPVKSSSSSSKMRARRANSFSLVPTRLPSDSRVPKSSSIPSRLIDRLQSAAANRRPASVGPFDRADTGERPPFDPAAIRFVPPSRIPVLVVRASSTFPPPAARSKAPAARSKESAGRSKAVESLGVKPILEEQTGFIPEKQVASPDETGLKAIPRRKEWKPRCSNIAAGAKLDIPLYGVNSSNKAA